MLELIASRAGPPTAVVRGSYLHSRYDPEREAQRFVTQALGSERPTVVVLLGAGLGYLVEALRRRDPGVRILSVFYDLAVHQAAIAAPDLSGNGPPASSGTLLSPAGRAGAAETWHPGHPEPLLDFLRARIQELDGEGLSVIEWPVSARLYPQLSREGNRAVRQLLRELRGSLVTTAALGRRWIANAVRNFVFLDRLVPHAPPAGPPVWIAASGASLEDSLRLLAPYRERFSLWALPSSLMALQAHGLRPDLIVLTDPGYYAVAHLHCAAGMDPRVALPLSAACGLWRLRACVLPLSQGTFFERALWALRGVQPLRLPALGTVAATALLLAQRLGALQIVMAGLDLCHRDLRTHARPSLFDLTLAQGCGRLSPFLHRVFAWGAAQRRPSATPGPDPRRSTLPLDTYAGWFANLQRPAALKLFRLLPSEVSLEAFTNLDAAAFRSYAEGLVAVPDERASSREPAGASPTEAAGTSASRAGQVRALLTRWVRQLNSISGTIAREGAGPLLADPVLLPLCYYADAAALAEACRRLRTEGPKAGAERLRELTASAARFLEGIRAALGDS